jgi:hypothetical protein
MPGRAGQPLRMASLPGSHLCGSREQQFPLPLVAREGGGALELHAGLGEAAEL